LGFVWDLVFGAWNFRGFCMLAIVHRCQSRWAKFGGQYPPLNILILQHHGAVMIRVEKVDCADFKDVQDTLINFWGKGSEEKWRKLFDYRWERDENYCGLALKEGDQTVGFIGMIFSRRWINGRAEKFCNLTSWFVRPEYRARAVSLLLPLVRMRDYTITDLTPSLAVYQIQRKVGFKDLDANGRILLPFGRRLSGPKPSAVQVTHAAGDMRQKLSADHRQILDDHLAYPCEHFLLSAGNRYCYIIYSKHKRKKLPFVYIHYISDPELFGQTYPQIRGAIMSHARSGFAVIDSRLVAGLKLPLSFCLPYRTPKQYLSSSLKPGQIDNLYSELVLLNLRNHPRLKYWMRNVRQKLFGSKQFK